MFEFVAGVAFTLLLVFEVQYGGRKTVQLIEFLVLGITDFIQRHFEKGFCLERC